MHVQVLIPAAGMGTRLGAEMPKALLPLGGIPLIARALAPFHTIGVADDAIITTPPGSEPEFESVLRRAFPGLQFTCVAGGTERQDSVMRGLDALNADTNIVAIHDAARPFVQASAIQASIDAAAEYGAATVAIPSSDTILVGDNDSFLVDTPDRSCLWACQTPQTFRVEVIREAHVRARREGLDVTDDATLVQRTGCGRPKLVMGSTANLKITTPGDLVIAEAIIAKELA